MRKSGQQILKEAMLGCLPQVIKPGPICRGGLDFPLPRSTVRRMLTYTLNRNPDHTCMGH